MASDPNTPYTPHQSQYPYIRINSQNRYIRLIKVLPESSSNIIRCKLLLTTLNDNPKYVALSYTWGLPYENAGVPLNDSTTSKYGGNDSKAPYDPKAIFLDGYLVMICCELMVRTSTALYSCGIATSLD